MGGDGYQRGVSSVLAVVLLLAIVILVSGSVVVIGSGAIENVQSRTVDQSAVTTMGELQSSVESVESGDGAARLTFARGAGATGPGSTSNDVVAVDETAGEITITVTDASVGTTESKTEPLGAVVYEGDDGQLLYQGGGVFRLSDDGGSSTIVSPPKFQYQYRGGAPTLRLSLPRVVADGPRDSGSFDEDIAVRQTSAQTQTFPTTGIPNPLEHGDTVEITVESRSAEAWATLFRERTEGTVTTGDFDGDGTPEARVTLSGPPDPSPMAPGAVVTSDVGELSFSNHAFVDSYDSSTGVAGPPGGGTGAPVYIDGEYKPSNHVYIDGDLIATDGAVFSSNDNSAPRAHVDGETILGGTAGSGDPTKLTSTNMRFGGVFSTQDDLQAEGKNKNSGKRALFEDDVYVGGDVTTFEEVRVEGSLYVQGDVELGEHSTVTGDVVAGGSITETGSPVQVDGEKNASASPPAPKSPSLPSVTDRDAEINAKESALSSDNDNPGDGTIHNIDSSISVVTRGDCQPDPCTLNSSGGTTGFYIPDAIYLDSGDKLILNTTEGPIDIYAGPDTYRGQERSLYLDEATIEVQGSNPVRIYNGGDVILGKDASVVTKDSSGGSQTYRAPNVQVFVKSSKKVDFNNDPSFTGVIHGSDGTSISLTNKATIYGSVVGAPATLDTHTEIHFDEALLNPPGGPGAADGGPNSVSYLDVTTSEVMVADD